ncbi:MAG: hypothetical protein M0024_06830, partial [Nitrospiraceae bacterium]|nr:hypothetical protein [Nitrospiraceae bacterium]
MNRKEGSVIARFLMYLTGEMQFIAYVPIAALLLIYLNAPSFRAHWLPVHDTLTQFTEFVYALSAYQKGELPLWNSYLYGGEPFYLYLSHGLLLNPFAWIGIVMGSLLKLSATKIFAAYHLSEILFFALGGLLLVRALTGSNLAATVAFIVLVFSGDASYWANQIYSFTVILFVPWILFLGLRYFRHQTVGRALVLAVLAGISFNAYYPAYLIAFMLTIAAITGVFRRELFRTIDFRKLLRHSFIALPVITLLILPTYLDYREINDDNYQISRFRGPDQSETYDDIFKLGADEATHRIETILPDMFVVQRKYYEAVPLIGALALACAAITLARPSGKDLYWLGLVVVMCLNYLGSATIYHRASYYLMPFYNIIRSPRFFSGFVAFTATVLACRGALSLTDREYVTGKRRLWIIRAALFLLVYGLLIFWIPKQDRGINIAAATAIASAIVWNIIFPGSRRGLRVLSHSLLLSFLIIGGHNLSIIKGQYFSTMNYKMFSDGSNFHFSFERPKKYTVSQPLPNEGECCATFYHIGERVDAPYFFDNWKSPHTLFLNREYYRVSATQGFDRLMTRKLHFLRYYTVASNVNDFSAYLDKSILVLGDDSKVGSLIG